MAKSNVAENVAVRRRPVWIMLGVVVVLVLAAYMLYPVARNYYAAWRENNQLEAEYQALLERNEKIREQVKVLGTPEGIQDWVRAEFGWVLEGERAINVSGLNLGESFIGLPVSIEPGSVDQEEHWWIKLLDYIFGVKAPEPAHPSQEYLIPGL